MSHLFLLALILCFVAILIFGFLDLVRELLTRDFFGAPSLPSAPPEQSQALDREAESHSATPLS
jgi:cytochrome b561